MIGVRVARFLPQRLRNVGPELAKFGTIGLVNTVVNIAVANALLYTVFPNGELKAKGVATIVATTTSYFMNRHWTYRGRPKSALRREYSLFFLFNLIGIGIEMAVLGIGKYGLHLVGPIWFNVFSALGILIGTLFRFWAYRTHVFKAGEPEDTPVSLPELVAHELDDHPHEQHHEAAGQAVGDLDGELDDLVARSDQTARST